MNPATQRRLDLVSVAGLALGAVFGMAGTFVSHDALRQVFWAVDGVGLVVAGALLAVKYLRRGDDCIAAGFLVFALGETQLLAGTAAGLEGSVPTFAAGVALWAAGLLMTSIPKGFALWTRVAGIAASVLFTVTAAGIFWGANLTPLSKPLPFYAYPIIVLTFVGWILTLVKNEG